MANDLNKSSESNPQIEDVSLTDDKQEELSDLTDSDSVVHDDYVAVEEDPQITVESNNIKYTPTASTGWIEVKSNTEKTEKPETVNSQEPQQESKERDSDGEEDTWKWQKPLPLRRTMHVNADDPTIPIFSREEKEREGKMHWHIRLALVLGRRSLCIDLFDHLQKHADRSAPKVQTVEAVKNFVLEHPHCFKYQDDYLVINENSGLRMFFPSVIHLIHSRSSGPDGVCLKEIFEDLRKLPDCTEYEALFEDYYFWPVKRPETCTAMLDMLFLKYPTIFDVHEEQEETIQGCTTEKPEEGDIVLKKRALRADMARRERIFIGLKPIAYTIPSFWHLDVFAEFERVYYEDSSREYGVMGTILSVVNDHMIVVQINAGFLSNLRAAGYIDQIGVSPKNRKRLTIGAEVGLKVVRILNGQYGLKIIKCDPISRELWAFASGRCPATPKVNPLSSNRKLF